MEPTGKVERLANPELISLFGGISGVTLSTTEFEIASGLFVRDTYAHVMAPYIMAFKKPTEKGAAHPGPWHAAKGGGLGFDVTIEIFLDQQVRPSNFDRLNTLWFVLSLLRLVSGAPIRMPVISDTSFANVQNSSREPSLWPLEMLPHQLQLMKKPSTEISIAHLQWIRKHLNTSSLLLRHASLNRAFQTFDSTNWAHSSGSALLMIWAAVEALFQPGRLNITKTLAATVATYLHSPGPERDREYGHIAQLYEARGNAAHNVQNKINCWQAPI